MIFLSKRTVTNEPKSVIDGYLSIAAFLSAIGILGGLAALIYGLIKSSFIWTIIGGVVLGISVFLTIIFILMIAFCLHK